MLHIKKPLLFIFSIAFTISSHAQLDFDKITKSKAAQELLDNFSGETFNNILPSSNLKGKVKSYKVKNYIASKKMPESKEYIPEGDILWEEDGEGMILFDELSRIIKLSGEDDTDKIIMENKYRNETKQYESIHFLLDEKKDNKKLEMTFNYQYTPDNKIQYINLTISDMLNSLYLHKYSPDGNLTEIWEKNDSEEQFWKSLIYEYKDGKLIRILKSYGYDETVNEKTKLTYDSDGRLIAIDQKSDKNLQIEYDEKGNVKRELEFMYFGDITQITKVVTYWYNDLNEETIRTEEEYKYNVGELDEIYTKGYPEKLLLVSKKITNYENGIQISETVYTTDENNNLQLDSKITAELKFDNIGNLIEKIETNSSGKIVKKKVYEVEYY